jgi:hypothetical protein
VPAAGGKFSIETEAAESAELLRAIVAAGSDAEADPWLRRLFDRYLTRWCRDAAGRALRAYGLHAGCREDEAAEVTGEVMLHLLARVREIRAGAVPPIACLRAYTVTTVYNTCFARIRARCPNHARLQNRIRYLLRNDRQFALWDDERGESLAGLRAWQGRGEALDDAIEIAPTRRAGANLADTLRAVFELAGAPVRFHDVVAAVAESTGIVEPVAIDSADLPGGDVSPDALLIQREELAGLWSEVLCLPPQQRAALLLNLREPGGQGVIELIPATGSASFEQLAEAVGMTPRSLACLWRDLPLDDARIAEMLNLTRQQVINLRKSARDRLHRRRGKAERAGNTTADSPSTPVRKGAGGLLKALFGRGTSHS